MFICTHNASGKTANTVAISVNVLAMTQVTSITLSPATIQVTRGSSQQYTATLTGIGSYTSNVIWSITGNQSPDTSISASGLLTVAIDEAGTNITVRATSVFSSSKYADAAANITDVYSYSGKPDPLTLAPGKYRIELWGAQGGYGVGNPQYKGNGAYVAGTIDIDVTKQFIICIGEYGGDAVQMNTGFNGGAPSSTYGGGHDGGRGGGATDIRLVGGNYDNINSLRSRIMVAAGGGGSQPTCGGYSLPGHGGALTGIQSLNPAGGYAGACATGGTQISGGTGNRNPIASGTFGKGGSCAECGAGGGGGYYGGGSCYTAGGGGGSSFISGHPGCNAIKSETDGTHTGQPIHYSGIKFTDTVMIAGDQSMPNPDGGANITGKTGNGAIRITKIVA